MDHMIQSEKKCPNQRVNVIQASIVKNITIDLFSLTTDMFLYSEYMFNINILSNGYHTQTYVRSHVGHLCSFSV